MVAFYPAVQLELFVLLVFLIKVLAAKNDALFTG